LVFICIFGAIFLLILADSTSLASKVDNKLYLPLIMRQGTWQEVGVNYASSGGISNNSANSNAPSLAVDLEGKPIVAWWDQSGGNSEIYVRAWDGLSWIELGANSASEGGISNNEGFSIVPSIATSPNGTHYVAWYDNSDGDYEIYVRRWDGSNWEEAGTGYASGGGISNNTGASYWPALAIAPDGMPYVAWADDSNGNYEIYVRAWNGSNWVEVGTGSASNGGISNNNENSEYPSIAESPGGKVYLAWNDSSSGDTEIYARVWDGNN
jgi:hypothetical protein